MSTTVKDRKQSKKKTASPKSTTKKGKKPSPRPTAAGTKSKKKKRKKVALDPHLLYQASVQSVEADLDFLDRVWKKHRGEKCHSLREDFCGTALLSCEWVKRRKKNTALAVDIHRPTLQWAAANNVSLLGDEKDRINLVCDDVRKVKSPRVEALMALNFSYFLFKDRDGLRNYFKSARESLLPHGMLVLDVFGGTESMATDTEDRWIEPSVTPAGEKLPGFTYVWDQNKFNPVNNDILCYIHFRQTGYKDMNKAFTYDWRLWSLPELQELLKEAGFHSVDVYMDGWDDEKDEADGIYRRRTRFENMAGWVAYIVAKKH